MTVPRQKLNICLNNYPLVNSNYHAHDFFIETKMMAKMYLLARKAWTASADINIEAKLNPTQ